MHYDIAAMDNCVNGTASFGEIFVRCNCCGRYDTDGGARLDDETKQRRVKAYWREYLSEFGEED